MLVITPSTISCEESVGDIIKSIALQESAVAHILNAESEKLQAIINMPNVTVADLLAANRSVKNTVVGLENALKAKLNLFSNFICQTA